MTVKVKFKPEYVKSLQNQLASARAYNRRTKDDIEVMKVSLKHWKTSYDSVRKLLNETSTKLSEEQAKSLWTRFKEAFTWA